MSILSPRESTLAENVDSKSCLENIVGELHLKRSIHIIIRSKLRYVYARKKTDFVVWTQNDIHVERIEPDVVFWNQISEKAKLFFKGISWKILFQVKTSKLWTRKFNDTLTKQQHKCCWCFATSLKCKLRWWNHMFLSESLWRNWGPCDWLW